EIVDGVVGVQLNGNLEAAVQVPPGLGRTEKVERLGGAAVAFLRDGDDAGARRIFEQDSVTGIVDAGANPQAAGIDVPQHITDGVVAVLCQVDDNGLACAIGDADFTLGNPHAAVETVEPGG